MPFVSQIIAGYMRMGEVEWWYMESWQKHAGELDYLLVQPCFSVGELDLN